MSLVVGIDLGNSNAIIAQAVRGGVDVILNESSKRQTPVLVSFVGNERYLGEQAATQVRTNMDNTVTQIKRLIGRKFSEVEVQNEFSSHLNFNIQQLENDEIGIEVSYNDQEQVFTPVQVLAMFLTKMREICAGKAGKTITTLPAGTPDTVLSVPAYYTDAQRQAVLDAAEVAGMNCLRLLNEGTAAALSYGIYKSAKKEFPDGQETKVLFLDMGNAHFTATIAGFTNNGLRILSSVSDAHIGGREIDLVIANYFAQEHKAKTGDDAWRNKKARLKLLMAAEKAKIAVTPYGVNSAPVSVECLMNDRDFSIMFTADKLEELTAGQMQRMQACIRKAMTMASVNHTSELLSVELVGGGMRPRIVKRRAAEALGLPLSEETGHGLSTSMNLDECISRGCALMCAMLTPVFRVKPYEVIDTVPFPINVTYEANGAASDVASPMDVEEEGDAAHNTHGGRTSVALFKVGDATPSKKRVTFKRTNNFEVTLEYASASSDANVVATPLPQGAATLLGRYVVAVPAEEAGDSAPRIRVDFKHDANGIVAVHKAEMLKEVAAPADAPPTEGETTPAEGAAPAAEGEEKKAKRVVKRIELAVSAAAGTPARGMSSAALKTAKAQEVEMIKRDAAIHARQDMRNSLEAYIYSTRDAVSDGGDLAPFGTSAAREALSSALTSMEDWLYNEGFEADLATYEAKLKSLKALGDPIARRKVEAEGRVDAIASFRKTIDDFRAVLNNTTGKHAHLTDSDRDTLRRGIQEAEQWLASKQIEQSSVPLDVDPVLKINDIAVRRDVLVRELSLVANKPVPAPAPAPAPAAAPEQPPAGEPMQVEPDTPKAGEPMQVD